MGSHPALSFTLLNCHGSNTHQSFACKNQSACRRVCDLLYSPCSDSWKNSLLCGFDISVPDKLSCHPCLFHYGPLRVQVCHCNLVRPRLCAPSTEPPCWTSQPKEEKGGVFSQTCNEALLQSSWKALYYTTLSKLIPSYSFRSRSLRVTLSAETCHRSCPLAVSSMKAALQIQLWWTYLSAALQSQWFHFFPLIWKTEVGFKHSSLAEHILHYSLSTISRSVKMN